MMNMNKSQAKELATLINGQVKRGEIAREVETSLEIDGLAKLSGLGGFEEIYYVIVDWPDNLKVVIRDEEQWNVRKGWFVPKPEE